MSIFEEYRPFKSRSPKLIWFFVMSQLHIHEYLVRVQSLVHKILCRQDCNAKIFSFSTTVTLKIRSKLPKYIQFFVMSQLYIHEKYGKNLTTGSQVVTHIVQTRKCHHNGMQTRKCQHKCHTDKKVSLQNFQFFYRCDLEN